MPGDHAAHSTVLAVVRSVLALLVVVAACGGTTAEPSSTTSSSTTTTTTTISSTTTTTSSTTTTVPESQRLIAEAESTVRALNNHLIAGQAVDAAELMSNETLRHFELERQLAVRGDRDDLNRVAFLAAFQTAVLQSRFPPETIDALPLADFIGVLYDIGSLQPMSEAFFDDLDWAVAQDGTDGKPIVVRALLGQDLAVLAYLTGDEWRVDLQPYRTLESAVARLFALEVLQSDESPSNVNILESLELTIPDVRSSGVSPLTAYAAEVAGPFFDAVAEERWDDAAEYEEVGLLRVASALARRGDRSQLNSVAPVDGLIAVLLRAEGLEPSPGNALRVALENDVIVMPSLEVDDYQWRISDYGLSLDGVAERDGSADFVFFTWGAGTQLAWTISLSLFEIRQPAEIAGAASRADQAETLLRAAEVLLDRELDESLLDDPSS